MNILELSKVDELSVRKKYVEAMAEQMKKQAEEKIMLLLANAFDENAETKATGQVVFMERWLDDINKEIERITNG